MADTVTPPVSTLAHLIIELERQRRLWRDWKRSADALERAGNVVSGENEMLDQLHTRLDNAQEKILLLENAKDDDTATAHMHALENCLYTPEWDLAQAIGTDLCSKHEKLVQSFRSHRQKLADCAPRVKTILALLRKAENAYAPVINQRSRIREIERLYEQCADFLQTQNLNALKERLSLLQSSLDEDLESGLKDSIKEAQRVSSHADLLLLKPPLHENRYKFTVLLRTPSHPGSHGINIQDTCPLHEKAYDSIKNRLKKMDQNIESVVRRSECDKSISTDILSSNAGTADMSNRQVRPIRAGMFAEPVFSITEVAKDLGDLMWRLLIPQGMQKYIEETPCSITITTNELELPWELMWADVFSNKFLCLERPVARMPMGRSFPIRKRIAEQSDKKLEFLLVYSDPHNSLPAAGEEIKAIHDSLAGDDNKINITALQPKEATGEKIADVLRSGQYDVIHYAGHAFFDESEPSESGLLLYNDEKMFSQNIQGLLEGRPVVFLNACETGQASNEKELQTVWRSLLRPTEGLASSFLYGGASNCIGAVWPVHDRPAAEFAVEFYKKVLEGHMIGEAMRLSRLKMCEKHSNEITWAGYVLYGDPTYRMV